MQGQREMGPEGRSLAALREWQERLPPRREGEGGEETWCGRSSVSRQTDRGRGKGVTGRGRSTVLEGTEVAGWGRFGELYVVPEKGAGDGAENEFEDLSTADPEGADMLFLGIKVLGRCKSRRSWIRPPLGRGDPMSNMGK